MEMIVSVEDENSENVTTAPASKTLMATRTSQINATMAPINADFITTSGRSQHTASTHTIAAINPAIHANHHPANDRRNAKTDTMAGRMASLLFSLGLCLFVGFAVPSFCMRERERERERERKGEIK